MAISALDILNHEVIKEEISLVFLNVGIFDGYPSSDGPFQGLLDHTNYLSFDPNIAQPNLISVQSMRL